MTHQYLAHSPKNLSLNSSLADWHKLEDHLKAVGEIARSFAKNFDAGDWAYFAGLWHDMGKYSHEFQQKLLENDQSRRVDHSTAGARHAAKHLGAQGRLLAYIIAGHHAGLPDGKGNDQKCLTARLDENLKAIPNYSGCPETIQKPVSLSLPPIKLKNKYPGFQIAFFTRMLYSCLVDADFLDTERFLDPQKRKWRLNGYSPERMQENLLRHLEALQNRAKKTTLNQHRAAILRDCLEMAKSPQGLFSLTVPTGGGKTLSSLAFAIKHAVRHGLRRIIYVIPYTSIIEQNAAIFADVLGKDAVVEHHSNFDPLEESDEQCLRAELATENWDAPLIVTTNVQFFESLFGCRSSRCRKLHNIVQSVIILDEAQMLPVPFLRPCIESLRELSANYSSTIILCTATQPALSTTPTFQHGLDGVREIVRKPLELHKRFKRVAVSILPTLSCEELANKLAEQDQVLCIVNTRKEARRIYEALQDKGIPCYHLSALMCPAHRTERLALIRERLAKGKSCRLISTQLIEAGVDIDFPVVFRAMAGIDSIAQAAGRCNREGKMSAPGEVFVFFPEDGLPPGYFRQSAEVAASVLRHHGEDPLSPAAVTEFFRHFYWLKSDKLDEEQILTILEEDARRGNFPFRKVAEKFQLIKDGRESIIIPWREQGQKAVATLRYSEFINSAFRRAQRFSVQVHPQVLAPLLAAGSVEIVQNRFYILTNMDLYRDDLGLCPENPEFHEVESLIL